MHCLIEFTSKMLWALMPINSKQLITHLKTCYLAGILSPVTLLYWSIVHILYIQKPMLSSKAWCWSAHFPWKVQLMILSWIWLALPNLISFAFVSTYHNYFRKSYQNMKLVLLWKPVTFPLFFPQKPAHSWEWSIPQFYIQLVYRPHFGAWILLFGPFGKLRH